MEDGQLGPNLVAVQSPVELELKNMSGLVIIPNQLMAVANVQVQHLKQRTALLSIAQ